MSHVNITLKCVVKRITLKNGVIQHFSTYAIQYSSVQYSTVKFSEVQCGELHNKVHYSEVQYDEVSQASKYRPAIRLSKCPVSFRIGPTFIT